MRRFSNIQSLIHQGDSHAALNAIEEASVFGPGNVDLLILKSQAFGLMGDYRSERATLRQILRADPEHEVARARLTEMDLEDQAYHYFSHKLFNPDGHRYYGSPTRFAEAAFLGFIGSLLFVAFHQYGAQTFINNPWLGMLVFLILVIVPWLQLLRYWVFDPRYMTIDTTKVEIHFLFRQKTILWSEVERVIFFNLSHLAESEKSLHNFDLHNNVAIIMKNTSIPVVFIHLDAYEAVFRAGRYIAEDFKRYSPAFVLSHTDRIDIDPKTILRY